MDREAQIARRIVELREIDEWHHTDEELRAFAIESIEEDEFFKGQLTDEEISSVNLFIFTATSQFKSMKLHLSLGIKPSPELEALSKLKFTLAAQFIETKLFRLSRGEIRKHDSCCATSRFVLQWVPHAKMFIYVR